MARSLSNVRMFSAYFANGIAQAIPRQGYSAAVEATAVSRAEGRIGGAVKLRPEKEEEEVTWMPDHKTGFFGPGNRRDEVDAVELRAMMLRRRDSHPVVPQ
ncbi:hypothetical protein MLD38_028124 [Melastoma candidum]|uniref:Uncharacterized protein n=1 Tax=Melastoma candidum TaxID=119954 RepID=A0ACB9N4C5_9MYRT|nr:hypothetical protein MLD38_028124 [Melastoma candidum]